MKTWKLLLALLALAAGLAHAESRVGCPLDVEKPVSGNLKGAGCSVSLDASVDGNVRLAGGSVDLGKDAAISGNATLAGGNVSVKGPVKGDLHAAGGHVLLDGPVGGDATVAAGLLDLGPNARIAGKLLFRGGELSRDPQAQVVGGIEHRRGRRHGFHDFDGSLGHWHGFASAAWIASLVLLAALFAALLPGFSRRMEDELRAAPWAPPLFGFIALVCIPVAAVLMMITIIGIPLGVLAILAYAALLLVGYVGTSVVTGGLLLEKFRASDAQRTAWRVGAAAAAMLVIALAARLPFLGGLVAFAALVLGLGLVVAPLVHRRAPPAAAA